MFEYPQGFIDFDYALANAPFGLTNVDEESQVAEDMMLACPLLCIRMGNPAGASEEESRFASCSLEHLAKQLGAEKPPLPIIQNQGLLNLSWNASTKATFDVLPKGVALYSSDQPKNDKNSLRIALGTYAIRDRCRMFLERTHTLGVKIVSPFNDIWIASLTSDNSPHPTVGLYPFTLTKQGTDKARQQIKAVIEHAPLPPTNASHNGTHNKNSWNFAISIGAIYAIGDPTFPHYTIVTANQKHNSYSGISWRGGCVLCGNQLNTSKEHLIPNWILSIHGTQAMIKPVLCKNCNNKLGELIEIPMKNNFTKGTWNNQQNYADTAFWCVKTAILLTIGSGGHLSNSKEMKGLLQKRIPKGMEVYIGDHAAVPNDTITYGWSVFNRVQNEKGYHLTSFSMDHLQFVVVRSPDRKVQCDYLTKIYPTVESPKKNTAAPTYFPQIHKDVMEQILGEQMLYTESSMESPRKLKPRHS